MAKVCLQGEMQCIANHWVRTLNSGDHTYTDLARLISDYALVQDSFDRQLCHESINVASDGLTASKHKNSPSDRTTNTIGTATASPGKVYHWTFKITKLPRIPKKDTSIHIGIVEADESAGFLEDAFWTYREGYSCKSTDGSIYHDGSDRLPLVMANKRQSYGEGDILEMKLDLIHNRLKFWKNDSVGYVCCKVQPETEYKLAVGMHENNGIELVKSRIYRPVRKYWRIEEKINLLKTSIQSNTR